MHPRLQRAWDRVRALAKEARLWFQLGDSSLIPVPEAVVVAIKALPEEARLAMALPDADVSEESYVANAMAIHYPLWGRANGGDKLERIPFRLSAGPGSSIRKEGWELGFTSLIYGWFDDLHIERRHVRDWIKGASQAPWLNRTPENIWLAKGSFELGYFVGRWPHPVDARVTGPPLNPDQSVMERQGQETDFDHDALEELLLRKLEAMDKTPNPELDVGKPRKRWRRGLVRR